MRYTKRRKYQAEGSVGRAFGRNNAPPPPDPKPTFMDHVIDVGEFALNTTLTPFETITGTNFYDPKYSSNFMQNTSDITAALGSAATDIAGTMVAGPLYHAGKLGVTKGSQALGLKDATHSDHNAWAEKTGSTIGFLGHAAGVLAGGVAEKGGKIQKAQYGNTGFNQVQPRFGAQFSLMGDNKYQDTYSLGADMLNCWGGSCTDEGGGMFRRGIIGNLSPFMASRQRQVITPEGEIIDQGNPYKQLTASGDISGRARLDQDFYGLGGPYGTFVEGFGGAKFNDQNIKGYYGGKGGLQFKSKRSQKLPTFGNRYMPDSADFMPQWQLDLYGKYASDKGKSIGADFRYGVLGAGVEHNLDTKQTNLMGGLRWNLERGGTPKKYQAFGQVNPMMGQNLLNVPQLSSPFNVSPSNFGDAGTWGQMDIPGGGTFSTTSNYARPFSTEKGNLYRGIEGGQHLTNEDISLLTSDVNAGYDASGNYQASITPNNYTGLNRFADKYAKPFANQTVVGAQQYGDAMKGNMNTLFGKNQGNIGERLGNLDAKSIGQTASLASAGAGIYNTWKPGARTQSELVGDAESALEASNIATLSEQGWYGNNWRGAERGGTIGECKECNKMKNHIMKYYKGGPAKKYYAGGMARPKMENMGQMSPAFMQNAPESTMPFLNKLFGPQDGGGSGLSNLFSQVKNYFKPNDEMGSLASAKNVTYRGNEATRNQNMDEFKRLFNPNTVVGQDRTYDDSARQANAGIGYEKSGILSNLGPNHKLYDKMSKNLTVSEYGGPMMKKYMGGGGVNNPGFKALPDAVQHNILTNMEHGGYTMKKYPGGGNIDPNSQAPIEIEVEGGETVKTIDGQDNKYIGPSHDQGGIITKANDGDFVYPKGTWAKRHTKRTERQAAILAKLEEAGIDTNDLV